MEHGFVEGPDNPAQTGAAAILERCGNGSHYYRNMLMFLAAEAARPQDVEDAVCVHLA